MEYLTIVKTLKSLIYINEKEHIEQTFGSTVRSVIDVPFSFGTLAVSSPEPEVFSKDDIQFMQEVAQVLSEGLRRTEDLGRIESQMRELEIDITERKKAEEKIRFQASLLKQVRNGIIATDLDAKIIFWNEYAEKLYQWKEEEVIGQNIVTLLSPQKLIEHAETKIKYVNINPAMESMFGLPAEKLIGKTDGELFGEDAGKHIREVDLKVLNGEIIEEEDTKPVGGISTTFHVIKVPMRDESNRIIGLCGISRDITERKKILEDLKVSKEYAKNIINSSLDIIISVDKNCRIVEFNSAQEAFGYTKEEIIGKYANILYANDSKNNAINTLK